MASNVVLFNSVMLLVDVAALGWVFWRRTAGAWWQAAMTGGFASALLLGFLGTQPFLLVALASDVLFLHGCLFSFVGAALLWRSARRTAVFSALYATVALAVAVDAFLIEPRWLEVSRVTIASPKVARKVRLVVLADFQTDKIGAYERRVLEACLREKPDVILLAGDYLACDSRQWDRLRREANALFKEVDFRAPEGVFAIEGNVDLFYPWVLMFEGLPVVLAPRTESFDVAGIRLTCLSVRDSGKCNYSLANDSPEKFHVVLGHIPNFAMGHVEADLLLAGHTHGGQVRLPWIGSLTNGCSVPLAWTSGVTELPSGAKLIVSRGTGMERGRAPRLRFCCRPEVVVIDLEPQR
ncbi:MAG: metallophosphoesterase [Pirellulales bacterium]|nr:metallophosphoesterase [Pirellulales bacterium]